VTVNDGGLKLLQIKDNGSGIHPDDLPILCHRHTTSKIEKYEDLASVTTLGFRGEALCSISFVSRLAVTTMQPSAEMGYKAEYRDSKMVTHEPEPCAAVQGTCIQVEDLFYNVPTRKKAMKSASEEFKRIFDVVAKYGTYCTGATFSVNTTHYNVSKFSICLLYNLAQLSSHNLPTTCHSTNRSKQQGTIGPAAAFVPLIHGVLTK
jgi:DNA mismatch repair protein MLH1